MVTQISTPPAQPIVILGGFFSFPSIYSGMRDALVRLTGQPVWVVQVRSYDWAAGVIPAGWDRMLEKVDHTVRRAVQHSTTGKVTLVAHSAGGIIARMYVSSRPIRGREYHGLDAVDHLISLGSPYYTHHRPLRGRTIEDERPARPPAAPVRHTSVAGAGIFGNRHGTLRERWAYRTYRRLVSQGDTWGDGLVPVSAALLAGSRHVTLDGVTHHSLFGAAWYGAEEVIPRWWNAAGGAE